MAVLTNPGFDLTPAPEQKALASNYITDFNFLNQYLPDTYEKEFERYGNRTISGFLRMVGAEMPSNSDLIKWAEQGRLHIKYDACVTATADAADTATWTITLPAGTTNSALRVGQTIMISSAAGAATLNNKAYITQVDAVAGGAFDIVVAYYGGWRSGCWYERVCCLYHLRLWF